MPLADVETIVFVMMENRSFDHLCGYLSMSSAGPTLPVEGLQDDAAWLGEHDNFFGGSRFPIHRLFADTQAIDDPPHDHAHIATQLGGGSGIPRMGGFVASYMQRATPPTDPSAVMGFYGPDAVPVYDFFARHYTVCDHWFAALPTGTQANRLMAMAGQSRILDNASVLLPDQRLAYDWLTDNNVSWCAYQSGDFFPFFALMARWLPEMTTSLALSGLGGRGRFRRLVRLRDHWTGAEAMPSVVFVEPEYTDGPHAAPQDDHPPSGIAKGQAFLADLYETLTANPARWARTLLIVTYDEHGGFFDHVPPLPITANVGGTPLATTGVRVPAFLVSPLVAPGVPFTGPLDHTSFLQLLADRFTPGRAYSPPVAERQASLTRLSAAIGPAPSGPVAALPLPPVAAGVRAVAATLPPSAGPSNTDGAGRTTQAFHTVAAKVAADHPDLLRTPSWAPLAARIGTGGNGGQPPPP